MKLTPEMQEKAKEVIVKQLTYEGVLLPDCTTLTVKRGDREYNINEVIELILAEWSALIIPEAFKAGFTWGTQPIKIKNGVPNHPNLDQFTSKILTKDK